jgi:lysophospholipase L1-like esterase
MAQNEKLWQRVGIGIIFIAAAILAYGLYNLRILRISNTGAEVFTGFFVIVLISTIAFHALLFIGLARFAEHFSSRLIVLWIALSLIGWGLLNQFLAGFKVYAGAYLVWLLLLNLGLLCISVKARLAKWQWETTARGLATIGFGIVISLVMLEVVMRLYFSLFGSQSDKVAYLYSVDEILAATNRYQGYPYINYGLAPNHPEHNAYGYRGEAFERPKAEGVFRIFALGGSTTFGASLSPQEAYPAQLQLVLHEDYAYNNVEVVNAGVSAYASADSLANLAYHVLDDEPDMIIIYDNINDVRARLVAPDNYSGLNLQRGIWSPHKLGESLSPLVIIRYLQIQLGIVGNPNQIESLLPVAEDIVRCRFELNEMCSDLGVPAQEILDSNPPIYFERNLRNMAAIAEANGVDVVFATWAYYSGETPLDNILSQAYVRNAANEHNNILRELATELDLPLIDFAVTVPVNPAYWQDGMHMTAEGTREQARQFAAYLVENRLIPNE